MNFGILSGVIITLAIQSALTFSGGGADSSN